MTVSVSGVCRQSWKEKVMVLNERLMECQEQQEASSQKMEVFRRDQKKVGGGEKGLGHRDNHLSVRLVHIACQGWRFSWENEAELGNWSIDYIYSIPGLERDQEIERERNRILEIGYFPALARLPFNCD